MATCTGTGRMPKLTCGKELADWQETKAGWGKKYEKTAGKCNECSRRIRASAQRRGRK